MKHGPTALDEHRGMAAQQVTEIRRRLADVEADQAALRKRRTELEKFLLAAPASTWLEAAEKARYLIGLFATTSIARDPRRQGAGRGRRRALELHACGGDFRPGSWRISCSTCRPPPSFRSPWAPSIS